MAKKVALFIKKKDKTHISIYCPSEKRAQLTKDWLCLPLLDICGKSETLFINCQML